MGLIGIGPRGESAGAATTRPSARARAHRWISALRAPALAKTEAQLREEARAQIIRETDRALEQEIRRRLAEHPDAAGLVEAIRLSAAGRTSRLHAMTGLMLARAERSQRRHLLAAGLPESDPLLVLIRRQRAGHQIIDEGERASLREAWGRESTLLGLLDQPEAQPDEGLPLAA